MFSYFPATAYDETIIEGFAEGIYCIKSIINGKQLLGGLGGKSENVVLWDLEKSNEIIRKYNGPESPIYSIAAEREVRRSSRSRHIHELSFVVPRSKNDRRTT